MMRHRTTAVILAAASLLPAACENDVGCGKGTCHVVLGTHERLRLGGDPLSVTHMARHRVTLSVHGVKMTLREGVTGRLGRWRIHVARVEGGEATLDVAR